MSQSCCAAATAGVRVLAGEDSIRCLHHYAVVGDNDMLDVQKTAVEKKGSDMREIEHRIKKIIAEQFCVKDEEVNNDASFVDDLNGDSLDMIELAMRLEEEFACHIPGAEAQKLATVQQAINCVVDRIDRPRRENQSSAREI